MRKILLIAFFLLFCNNVIFCSQDTTLQEIPLIEEEGGSFGYVIVKCDSLGINIFIDNMLAGQIPIENPIPLSIGKHTISYFNPGFSSLLKFYYNQKEINEFVRNGIKEVYVVPGETITVELWWKPYEKALTSRKRQHTIKSGVGIVLLTALLLLTVQLTN